MPTGIERNVNDAKSPLHLSLTQATAAFSFHISSAQLLSARDPQSFVVLIVLSSTVYWRSVFQSAAGARLVSPAIARASNEASLPLP